MTENQTFLSPDGNLTYPFDLTADCTEIHKVNNTLQCLFATTVEDCVEIVEYLDYNYYVFCNVGLSKLFPATASLILWLTMLFIALGVTSNYFLCPALFTISNHLGLSQNVAGVTLLAFGNGSPDIFSSVAGLQKASAELAIASLIGAGMFVTCVVAGSVFITQSFTLMIRPFMRDVAFYIVAITWSFALFHVGASYLYHGIGFVALYLLYIIVVLSSRFIYLGIQKRKESKKANEKEKKKAEEVTSPSNGTTGKKTPSNGTVENPEINVDAVIYDNDPEATAVVLKAFYYGGFEWIDGGRRLSKAHIPLDERRKSLHRNVILSLENKMASSQSAHTNGTSSTEKLTEPVAEDRGELWEFMAKLCPVNTKKWPDLPWWKKFLVVFKSPSIFIMRLTVPVLDTSLEDLNWNRLLICTQCITGPLFICVVSGYASYMIADVFPVILILVAACLVCSVLVFCTSGRDDPPSYHWLFAYLGFAVAVTWVYCLANEIVALLQVFGVMYNLSDAILGLTILAWGNSLSDFLSNIAVARKDFPRMAISACFGGPLLALLLGLGIPCILEVIKGRAPLTKPLHFSAQFAFLFAAIGIGLVTTACCMIAWKFKTKRSYGVFLILLYVTFVVLSVLEELKIFTLTIH